MKAFYVIKSQNRELKKEMSIAIKCLLITLCISIMCVPLCLNALKSIEPSDNAIDAMANITFFDISELEGTENDTRDSLVEKYIKANGDIAVFDELFEKRQSETNE